MFKKKTGRKKLPDKKKLSYRFMVSLTPEEGEELEKLAGLDSPAYFTRQTLRRLFEKFGRLS